MNEEKIIPSICGVPINQGKITISNTVKLNGIRGFSISIEKSCRPTTECYKYCYGKKGRFLLYSINYEDNYNFSLQDNFIELMNKELSNNERFFRIHPIGDFYSLDYFNKWVTIAKMNKHITFLAYTRIHELFKMNRPTNFKLIYSVDKSTCIIPNDSRKALVIPNKFKEVEHLKIEMFNYEYYKICTSGNCLDCLECYEGNMNIAFPQKYNGYD